MQKTKAHSILPFIISALLCGLCSCTAIGTKQAASNNAVKYSPPVGVRTVRTQIKRTKYKEALERKGGVNKVRLVQIFPRSRSASNTPKYRFFEVHPNSVYNLLTIQSADVLIAANDHIIPDQPTFWKYLQLLRYQKEAWLHIEREGQVLTLRYEFVD